LIPAVSTEFRLPARPKIRRSYFKNPLSGQVTELARNVSSRCSPAAGQIASVEAAAAHAPDRGRSMARTSLRVQMRCDRKMAITVDDIVQLFEKGCGPLVG
jgi:hypothetical protein